MWECFYWNSVYHDIAEYIHICSWCQIVNGQYTEPHTPPGSLVANDPLDLLCITFTKIDPSIYGNENALVLTQAFSKFSQAFVTINQRAFLIGKVLVDKWFYVYGVLADIHSDKDHCFEIKNYGIIYMK